MNDVDGLNCTHALDDLPKKTNGVDGLNCTHVLDDLPRKTNDVDGLPKKSGVGGHLDALKIRAWGVCR
jgi:hypothetical protein